MMVTVCQFTDKDLFLFSDVFGLLGLCLKNPKHRGGCRDICFKDTTFTHKIYDEL